MTENDGGLYSAREWLGTYENAPDQMIRAGSAAHVIERLLATISVRNEALQEALSLLNAVSPEAIMQGEWFQREFAARRAALASSESESR
jgi:hypothetical protein